MRATPIHGLGIGFVFTLAGFIGVITGLILAHKDYLLNYEGVATNATVTALTSKQYSKGTEYTVYNSYQDASGVDHDANSVVRNSEWRSLRVYGPVPILFVRDDPTENRVNLPYEKKLYHDNGTITPLFGGFIAFLGIGLMIAAYLDTKFPRAPHYHPPNNFWPMSRPKTYKFHKTY